MQRWGRSLFFFILTITNAQASSIDGDWILTIKGTDQIEFGTEHLAGGLQIGWITTLEFTLENGVFVVGSGTASLQPDIDTFSRPVGMFECEQVIGTFASRSGVSFSTPHLRYQAYPVSGKVVQKRIQLVPFLEYPGNYFAVLYECSTDNDLGSFWIERSPRVSRELSKRQDSIVKQDGGRYRANIKEVKSIAPGMNLELPLIDGLDFHLTDDYGLRKLHYQLKKKVLKP